MSAAATGVVAGAIVWGREESINLFMSSVVGGASRGECAPPAVAESAFGDTTVAADKGSIGVNGPETIEGSELLSVILLSYPAVLFSFYLSHHSEFLLTDINVSTTLQCHMVLALNKSTLH